jgi:hypothetical protein
MSLQYDGVEIVMTANCLLLLVSCLAGLLFDPEDGGDLLFRSARLSRNLHGITTLNGVFLNVETYSEVGEFCCHFLVTPFGAVEVDDELSRNCGRF